MTETANNTSEKSNELNDASVPDYKPTSSPPPVDLGTPGVKKALALRIAADIDKHCEATYSDGHRTHLGASAIGHECSRYLWFVFRWVSAEQFNGRQLRLFQRGHREEPFLFEHLRGMGCQVWEWESPPIYDRDGTIEFEGKQFHMSGLNGHYGGSIDAVAKLPPHYNVSEPMLVSCKTNATGKGFSDLAVDGVKMHKPQHFAQESVYGRALGIKYVIYVNRNKNDDDQYVEVVELDFNLAEQLEKKAERIILSQEPPPRLSESPAFQTCKYCWFGNDKTGICFKKPGHIQIDRNCRSCKHASPGNEKTWQCGLSVERLQMGAIPIEVIKTGCSSYEPIV